MDNKQETEESLQMIADYMEKGFLENIIDMFKNDTNYYPFIGDLLNDERIGVRIGITALVESLKEEEDPHLHLSIKGIAKVLNVENPTIRGDAASLLGIIGDRDALPYLERASHDENSVVREAVEEAIEDIEDKG